MRRETSLPRLMRNEEDLGDKASSAAIEKDGCTWRKPAWMAASGAF